MAGRGGSLGLANVQVGDVVHWAALAGAVQLATGAGGGQHWLSRRGWRAIGHDIYRLVLRAANSIDLPLMSARGEVAVDITEGLIAAIDDREAIGDDRLVWVDVVVCCAAPAAAVLPNAPRVRAAPSAPVVRASFLESERGEDMVFLS